MADQNRLDIFRSSHPEYEQWDDVHLSKGLYNKYYKDKMSFRDFHEQTGGDLTEQEVDWIEKGKILSKEFQKRKDPLEAMGMIPFGTTETVKNVMELAAFKNYDKNNYETVGQLRGKVADAQKSVKAGIEPIYDEEKRYHMLAKQGHLGINEDVGDDELTVAGMQTRKRDEALIENFIMQKYEEDIRGVGKVAKITEGIANLASYAFEMAGTGGLANVGGEATQRAILKLFGKGAKGTLKRAAIRQGLKVGTWAGRGVARGTVGFAHETMSKVTGKRRDIAAGMAKDETVATSLVKAWGDTVVEVASEELGGAITKGGSSLLKKVPGLKRGLVAAKKLNSKFTYTKLVKTIFNKAKYDGLIGEYGEERAGTIMRAVLGIEEYQKGGNAFEQAVAGLRDDFKNIGIELPILATPMAAGKVAGVAAKATQETSRKIADMKKRHEFKKFANTVKGTEFLVQTNPKWASDISKKENPSRKDFEDFGITGWSAKERAGLAKRLKDRIRTKGLNVQESVDAERRHLLEKEALELVSPAAPKEEAKPTEEVKPVPPRAKGKAPENILVRLKKITETMPQVKDPDKLSTKIALLLEKQDFITKDEFTELANDTFGGTRGEGKWSISDAYDELEVGINVYLAYETNPSEDIDAAIDSVEHIENLIERIPTQRSRSGEKETMQQFSTPPHYSYVAAWLANITESDTVLEPSAGTGGLAIHAKNAGATVRVNELSARRAELLKRLGFDEVSTEDAEQIHNILPEDQRPSVILMNPPFSRAAHRLGKKKVPGTDRKHVDSALKYLQDGGRLVTIMGAPREAGTETNAFAKWIAGIKKNYNVRGHIIVPRNVYKKYGTEFPTRVLVIDKTGPTTDTIGKTVDNLKDLMYTLQGVRDERTERKPETGKPDSSKATGTSEVDTGPDKTVPDATGGVAGPGAAEQPSGTGKARGARGGGVPTGGTKTGEADTTSAGGKGRGAGGRTGTGGQPGAGGGKDAGESTGAGRKSVKKKITDTLSADKQKRLEELKKKIRDKLNNQVNVGVDPETMLLLTEAGALYIEAGVRTFAEWAKLVTADLGPKVKPYLKSTYMFLRNAPETSEWASDMDKSSTVEDITDTQLDEITKADETGERGKDKPKDTAKDENEDTLFREYKPQKNIFKGSQPHPSQLVESVAMSAVEPPSNNYTPAFPKRIITDGVLSEAQLVPVAQAGAAHDSEKITVDGRQYRRGYFIGDGTGVGKGRELAGVILDNWHKGRKKAIYISKGKALLDAIQRDWEAMGENPDDVFLAKKMGDKVKEKQGILYMNYETIHRRATQEGGASRIDQLVEWFGEDYDGVIIFDEAHRMGTTGLGNVRASLTALAGIELQERLPNARVVYSSATGATEVNNFGYADRLGLWGEGTPFDGAADFVSSVTNRGVAAMELLSQSLKALGMYCSRRLSNNDGTPEGTVVYSRNQVPLTSDNKAIYDHLAGAWQIVLRNLDAALAATGRTDEDGDSRGGGAGRARAAFWGAQLRFFNQIITAMKTPALIRDAQAKLDKGEAVLIQLTSTMEAAMNRAMARMQEGDSLDDLDLTPRDILIQYLENAFPIQQWEEQIDENNNIIRVPAVDSHGKPIINREAVAARDRLIASLQDIRIPDSPLDMIINHFGAENVAEITGRSHRVVISLDDQGHRTKVVEKRTKKSRDADKKAFEEDKKQVLIFSEAGGTGESYHASIDIKNQRHRNHYLLQPGWNIKTALQGMGRGHRTAQATAPSLAMLESDLPGERRFISTLARRLGSTGALVAGDRTSFSEGLLSELDNLEGRQATDALRAFFNDLVQGEVETVDIAEFEDQTGLELRTEDGGLREALPPITRFLNRLLSLKIDMQNRVFAEYEKRLREHLDIAIQNGTLDTGMENIRADKVEKTGEQIVFTHEKTGAKTRHVKTRIFTKTKEISWDDLHDRKTPHVGGNPIIKFIETGNGKVYAVTEAADWTDPTNGKIKKQYRLIDQKDHHFIDQDRIDYDSKGFYTTLDAGTAKTRWAEEVEKLPEFKSYTLHFLTGAVLPIWKRLPDEARVKRVVITETGEEVLGLTVRNIYINDVLRSLGATEDAPDISPKEALERVAKGEIDIELSNKWLVTRRRIEGENRVEIEGADEYNADALEKAGVKTEKISWRTRYFIPIGKHEVLEKITKDNPIVRVINHDSGVQAMSETQAHAVPLEVPVDLEPSGEVKKIGAMEIVKAAEFEFDIPIRTGKGPRHAAGWFKVRPEVVRTQAKYYGHLGIMAHEVGHFLDKIFGIRKKNMPNPAREELRGLDYEPAKRRTSEGFAEFIRIWMTTDLAPEMAPEFYDHFINTWIKEHPDIAQKLWKIRGMINQWRAQGAVSRVASQIVKDGKSIKPAGVSTLDWIGGKLELATSRLYSAMKDEGHFLSRFVKEAKRKGMDFGKGTSPYELFLAFSQSGPTHAAEAVENGVFKLRGEMNRIGPSMKDVFKNIKPEQYDDFTQFAYAKFALELYQKRPGYNPGISKVDAETVYKKLYSDEFNEAAQTLTDFNNALIWMMVDAGVITASAGRKIVTEYEHYIPLLRVHDDMKTEGLGGKKLLNVPEPLKRRTRQGIGLPIHDPVQATLERAVRFYERSAQQIVINGMVEVAMKAEGMGKQMEFIRPSTRATAFTLEEIKGQLSNIGVDVDELIESGEVDPAELLFIYRPNYQVKAGKAVARVIADGKPRLFEFDPDLFRAINGMNYFQLPGVLRWTFGLATRGIKLGATGINVAFGQRNILKDYQTFLAQSKAGGKAAYKALPFVPGSMLNAFVISEANYILGKEQDPIVELWKQMGGPLANILGLDNKKIRKKIRDVIADSTQRRAYNIARNPIEAARDLVGVSEVGPRLAEFQSVLVKHGYTKEKLLDMIRKGKRPPQAVLVEAINAANDVTTNFKRQGWLGKYFNRMIPYFNAPLEGADKYVRTWRSSPARALTFTAINAAVSLAYWLMVKDDDWYEEQPAWLKYGFYTIPINGKPIVRIPRPHLWGVTFGAGMEAMLNRMYKDDPKAVTGWAKVLYSETGLPEAWHDALPAGAKQLYEVAANQDTFRDRPIVNDALQRQQSQYQYYDYNLELSKWMGKQMDISPAKIDHFVNGISGGLYRNVAGLPEGKSKMFNAFSLTRDYSESSSEFYDEAERVSQEYTSARDHGTVSKELRSRNNAFSDFRSLMSDMRNTVEDRSDRDERFDAEKYTIGLSRFAMDKPELDRYPNPLTATDLPPAIETIIEGYLGNKMYRVSDPDSTREKGETLADFRERQSDRKRSIELGEALVNRLAMSEKRALALLKLKAKARGFSTKVFDNGKLTAYGRRTGKIKKLLE